MTSPFRFKKLTGHLELIKVARDCFACPKRLFIYFYLFFMKKQAWTGTHLGALPFQAGRGPWALTVKWRHISVGGSMTPCKFEFWVSETAFPVFWGYFWAKYKGLKTHSLTVYLIIFKKYFGQNEIRRTSLHLVFS